MTVTVWGTSQSPGVNIRVEVATVPSERSLDENPTETSAEGWESRTTVKPSVPPASVVTRPEVGVTVMPAGMGPERLSTTLSKALPEKFLSLSASVK